LEGMFLCDKADPFIKGGEFLTNELAVPAAESAGLVVVEVPVAVGWEKYPPGEGRPSGPRPGLRLRTRVGGLQRWKRGKQSIIL